MVEKYVTEFRVVCGATGGEFQENLNQTMADLAADSEVRTISYEFNKNEGHCCYISYERFKMIPETLTEKYELKGNRYFCFNCPYFKPTEDKRIKYSFCEVADCRCHAKAPACDEFYKLLEGGRK